MYIYARHKYCGALYAECSKAFGAKPFCMIEHCKGETIIHLPYVQIILTPPSLLQGFQASLSEDETHDHGTNTKTKRPAKASPKQQQKQRNRYTPADPA